ncbi:hypothetical protein LCGC14_0535140 [marine sediment metagenome]|uniref:Uncharacterized protein n=1 Tax=marine sediment metagenome TaxID=412755 RepID=A0A0F9UFX6_9ZZZZ
MEVLTPKKVMAQTFDLRTGEVADDFNTDPHYLRFMRIQASWEITQYDCAYSPSLEREAIKQKYGLPIAEYIELMRVAVHADDTGETLYRTVQQLETRRQKIEAGEITPLIE